MGKAVCLANLTADATDIKKLALPIFLLLYKLPFWHSALLGYPLHFIEFLFLINCSSLFLSSLMSILGTGPNLTILHWFYVNSPFTLAISESSLGTQMWLDWKRPLNIFSFDQSPIFFFLFLRFIKGFIYRNHPRCPENEYFLDYIRFSFLMNLKRNLPKNVLDKSWPTPPPSLCEVGSTAPGSDEWYTSRRRQMAVWKTTGHQRPGGSRLLWEQERTRFSLRSHIALASLQVELVKIPSHVCN